MTAAMALQVQQANASCVRLNPGDQDLTVSLTMPNIDRPYPLVPGLVKGEAVLTADYR